MYYNTINARKARPQHIESSATDGSAITDGEIDGEEAPLLRRRRSSAGGLPGSHRRHSVRHEESGLDSLKRVVTGEDETPDRNPWLTNTLGLIAVWIVGALGWFVSYRAGAWDGPDTPDAPNTDTPVAVVGIVLGYASALCYLWCVQSRVFPSQHRPLPRRRIHANNDAVPGFPRLSKTTGRSPAKVRVRNESAALLTTETD